MRVITGTARGRVLKTLSGDATRPTTGKVKEAIFSSIQFELEGRRVLDLFAGSGGMGIEALSRGAKSVHFNDADRKSIALLKENLNKLKVEEEYSISNLDGITLLKNTDKKFDFIYLDPPYNTDLGVSALEVVSNALSDNGLVIFEDQKPFNKEINNLKIVDARKYGRIHLTFFSKGE